MALLSQEPPGLVPSRDRRDAPPRRVLPLVVVELMHKKVLFTYLQTYRDLRNI